MSFEVLIQSPFAVATYPPGATFGPRTLRNFEFVWIMEGDAVYKVGGGEFAAVQNSVVLCRPTPGLTDFFRWDTTRRTRHAYFHFDLAGDLPYDWPTVFRWPIVQKEGVENGLLTTLFRHLLASNAPASPASQTDLLVKTLLGAFVTGQFELDTLGGGKIAHGSPMPDLVRDTMAFIARQLDEGAAPSLSLDDLACHVCVTPAYLCRVFAQSTQHSPMETVRQARLDKAAILLARTNFSVGEIAHLCGFASPFHFSRCFRAAFGQSPRQMRQNIADGGFIPASRFDRQVR